MATIIEFVGIAVKYIIIVLISLIVWVLTYEKPKFVQIIVWIAGLLLYGYNFSSMPIIVKIILGIVLFLSICMIISEIYTSYTSLSEKKRKKLLLMVKPIVYIVKTALISVPIDMAASHKIISALGMKINSLYVTAAIVFVILMIGKYLVEVMREQNELSFNIWEYLTVCAIIAIVITFIFGSPFDSSREEIIAYCLKACGITEIIVGLLLINVVLSEYADNRREYRITAAISNDISKLEPINNYESVCNSLFNKYSPDYLKISKKTPDDLNSLIKEKLQPICDANFKKVEDELQLELMSAPIENNYQNLYDAYNRRYRILMISYGELTSLIKKCLDSYCTKNKDILKKNVSDDLKTKGMVEFKEFSRECTLKYGRYCIGDENIISLINSYILSEGEDACEIENGDILIRYPGATSGTCLVQTILEMD